MVFAQEFLQQSMCIMNVGYWYKPADTLNVKHKCRLPRLAGILLLRNFSSSVVPVTSAQSCCGGIERKHYIDASHLGPMRRSDCSLQYIEALGNKSHNRYNVTLPHERYINHWGSTTPCFAFTAHQCLSLSLSLYLSLPPSPPSLSPHTHTHSRKHTIPQAQDTAHPLPSRPQVLYGKGHQIAVLRRAQVERSLLYTLPGGEPKMRPQIASLQIRMFW